MLWKHNITTIILTTWNNITALEITCTNSGRHATVRLLTWNEHCTTLVEARECSRTFLKIEYVMWKLALSRLAPTFIHSQLSLGLNHNTNYLSHLHTLIHTHVLYHSTTNIMNVSLSYFITSHMHSIQISSLTDAADHIAQACEMSGSKDLTRV